MPDGGASARPALLHFEGNRPVLALLTIGAALLVFALGAAYSALGQVTASNERVEHTLVAKGALARLIAFNERTETARRGYLISGESEFVRIVRGAQAELMDEADAIETQLSNNATQVNRVRRLRALAAERDEILTNTFLTPESIIALARRDGFETERGVAITRAIRVLANRMVAEEDRLLIARSREQVGALRWLYLVGGTALLLLLGVMASTIVLVLRYNRDLSVAELGLRRANEGLEEAVSLRTAELSRANQEIQRFAYIVSHDLRSPLVNVLGFTAELDEARKTIRAYLADLFARDPQARDEGAWTAVDEDLPEALDFIRSSTEKMDRLINSILELSRQGRRLLTPEPLDMDVLVDGVVTSLHRRAADAGANVVVKPLPSIESDRIAVEQILSNLIENALKYLDPSRPGEIIVEGRRAGDRVLLDVIDNGRGIDPSDHERVFDLFRRAGKQDQEGEGIGLANVRALAYRLGGSIELESELDRGARFRLTLPARFVATDITA